MGGAGSTGEGSGGGASGDGCGDTGATEQTVELPPDLPALPCGLDVVYQARSDRRYNSRLVRRPTRPSRLVTVVVGFYDGAMVLYTAYGGPAAPREVHSPGLERVEVAASEAFWSEHALSLDV